MKPSRLRLLAAALLLWGCVFDASDGGGSSETTNGFVQGGVRRPDGSPAAGVSVTMRPRTYLMQDHGPLAKRMRTAAPARPALRVTAETSTDAAGRFAIDSIEPGDYILEASDSGRAGALYEFTAEKGDTVTLEVKDLRPTGTVTGIVAIDSGRLGDARVQIYGMERYAEVDSSGRFSFPDLPAGSYTLRAELTHTAADPKDIPGVQALSDGVTDIGYLELATFDAEDYATWARSRVLVLNTTASGADVKNGVGHFPLLVRLDAGNFDFTQSDGRDIRFADRNGRRLRYQVERWDALNHQAEIWVKVDTIQGDSRADFLTMYWDKPGAPDWSDGRQVFDTAGGYGGVWHLGEEAPDTAAVSLYQDATPHAQHGDDRIAATGLDGLIGAGHAFGFGDYIRATPTSSLRPSKSVLVSAWYRGDTTDAGGADIASLGDSYGLRVERSGNVRFFTSKGSSKGWHELTTKGVNVLNSAWHHLAGVFSGTQIIIYVDGVEKAKASASTPIQYDMGPHFYIARHGTGKSSYDLRGHLDEVFVVNRNRGPSYVKLCFESQRMNPTLIEFQ